MSLTDLLAYQIKSGMYMNERLFMSALKSIGIDLVAMKKAPKKQVAIKTTTDLDNYTKMQLFAVIERDTKLNPQTNKDIFVNLLQEMKEVYRNNYDTSNLLCQQQFVQKVKVDSQFNILF